MDLILIAVGGLGTCVALIACVGALLPRNHVAEASATFGRAPHDLFAIVRDVAAAPAWRSGVKAVELLPLRDGRVCYREVSAHGAVTYVVKEERPPERFVTEIADPDLPFAGSWTFELAPAASGGTTLRITERGEVKNVIFRFVARFVFGHTRTLETYLGDLRRRAAEPAPAPA